MPSELAPAAGHLARPGIVVSVVIPTFNRNALLRRTLLALFAQRFDPARVEILVVDDGCHPATAQLVREMARGEGAPRLCYLKSATRQGPAAARNRGWRRARGQFIAFTDDDTLPDRDWLAAGLAAFGDSDLLAAPVDAVSGKTVVPLAPQPTDYARSIAGLATAEFVSANCFFRRATLERLGGLDENFKIAYREDSDVFYTLLERGGRVVYTPNAVVVHPVRPAPWGVSAQLERKNLYDALLYKKHPRLYRERIWRAPNARYLAATGALGAALLGLGTGHRRIGAAAAVAWAGLTGDFARRRLQYTSRAPAHVAEMLVTSAVIPPLSIFWRLAGAIKYRTLFL